MRKENLILKLWSLVCGTLVIYYVSQCLFNTIKIYKLSNGTTLKIEPIGLCELALIGSAYYITKILLKGGLCNNILGEQTKKEGIK